MFHLWVPFWTIEHNKHLTLSSCAQQKYFSSHDSWNVRLLACFDRDMFRSKYVRRVHPWSFSMLCRWRYWGRGLYLLPLQCHTRQTSLSTWLPMHFQKSVSINKIIKTGLKEISTFPAVLLIQYNKMDNSSYEVWFHEEGTILQLQIYKCLFYSFKNMKKYSLLWRWRRQTDTVGTRCLWLSTRCSFSRSKINSLPFPRILKNFDPRGCWRLYFCSILRISFTFKKYETIVHNWNNIKFI